MGSNSPLIVIGMHRSGTSLVARILEGMGAFMGRQVNQLHEAVFFLAVNRRLFALAHARWDYPGPVEVMLERLETERWLREELVGWLARVVGSQEARAYWPQQLWGMLGRAGVGELAEAMGGPWGWKDPRNTYTLGLWLKLWPEARVVHVYRNGVDVAQSLRRRERAYRAPLDQEVFSFRCLELEGGFGLWAEYGAKARAWVEALGRVRAFEVCYERLLTEPAGVLQELGAWAGLKPTEQKLRELAGQINPERAWAFRRQEQLVAFYEQVKDHRLMRELGYGELAL